MFYENSFVGMGYDYLTKKRLKSNKEELRYFVAEREGLKLQTPTEKGRATRIVNMSLDFAKMKKGDVVIIPTANSDQLAFGEIADDEIYQVDKGTIGYPHVKRRKVEWLKIESWHHLDPKLGTLKLSHDALRSVDEVGVYIDQAMRNLFVKDDRSHFVIDVRSENPVLLNDLISLLTDIRELSHEINNLYDLGDNVDDMTVRLNLQSPGITELIKYGRALIFVGAMITMASCERGESSLTTEEEDEALELNDQFQERIDSITQKYDAFQVPQDSRIYFK